ncbi:hypothetical protein TI05_03885 [Achromatium sp. WMS3]|nr:hypothetical protein TI05_03885 [Achromatium sp. WMS3]
MRELIKSPECRNELLGTVFGFKIIGAILMWLIILTAIHLTSNDTQTNINLKNAGYSDPEPQLLAELILVL